MKIVILEQEYFYKPKEEKKILAILHAFGIKYSKETNVSELTLGSLGFTLRTQNILFRRFNAKQLDWKQATMGDLVNMFSRSNLAKGKGCGKRTIQEIEDVLLGYGYELKT